jgi:hypothetical protein
MIFCSEFYRLPAGVAGLREIYHDLSRTAAAEGAVRKIIPSVLDDGQHGIEVAGLFNALY